MSQNKVNGNIFITLVVYVNYMKKSEWLDCHKKQVFPKTKGGRKGTPSLCKIEHKSTATVDLQVGNTSLLIYYRSIDLK